jgi:hypothetical protein
LCGGSARLALGERFANVKAHHLNRTTRPLLQYLPKLRDAGEIHYFYPSHSQYFAEAADSIGKSLVAVERTGFLRIRSVSKDAAGTLWISINSTRFSRSFV